jgi:cytochrome c-type biogenesis protein CcmH/NrfG
MNFELPDRENRRFLRERPDNPDAVNYILRARAILNRTVQTKEDDAEAWQLTAAALRLDPQNSEALITLANADVNQVEDFLSDDRTEQAS